LKERRLADASRVHRPEVPGRSRSVGRGSGGAVEELHTGVVTYESCNPAADAKTIELAVIANSR